MCLTMFLNTLAQFLYLSFLLIIPLRAIVVNKNEFSIDGSDIGLTSTLQAQIPHLTNSKGKILGNATMISIKGNGTKASQGRPITFKVPYFNSDIAGGRLQFLMAATQGNLIPYKKVRITHDNFTNIIPSNTDGYSSNETVVDTPDIDCFYKQTEFKFKISSIANKDTFSKVIHYQGITFGQIGNEIYVIGLENNNQINKENIKSVETTNHLQTTYSFNTFFIIDSKGYLLLIENSNNKIHQFLIKNNNNDITIQFIDTITIGSNSDTINQIRYYNDKFYIATSSQLYVHPSPTSPPLTTLKLLDFVINADVLYGIKQDNSNKGITIYYLTNNTEKHYYPLQNVQSIDLFQNPFTSYNYTGVSFDSSSPKQEIFIEFLIDFPGTLYINKIFSSSSTNFLKYTNVDKFFSYFYSKDDNKLYIIRRAMLSSLPFQIYYIDFSSILSNTEVPTFISALYNSTEEKYNPVLITNQHYYVINSMELPEHHLNCTFNLDGNIILRFIQFADACQESIKYLASYSFCEKLVDFNFQVDIKNNNKTLKIIIIVVIIAFSLLLIIIAICLIRQTKCCKTDENFKLTRVGVDKTNKKKLYDSDEEEEEDDDEQYDQFDENEINTNIRVNKYSRHRGVPSSSRGLMDDGGSSSRREYDDGENDLNAIKISTTKSMMESTSRSKKFDTTARRHIQRTQTDCETTHINTHSSRISSKKYSRTNNG